MFVKSTLKFKKGKNKNTFLNGSCQWYCAPLFIWTHISILSVKYFNSTWLIVRFFPRCQLFSKCLNSEMMLIYPSSRSQMANPIYKVKSHKNEEKMMKPTKIFFVAKTFVGKDRLLNKIFRSNCVQNLRFFSSMKKRVFEQNNAV